MVDVVLLLSLLLSCFRCCCRSTFGIPFSRSASFDDNLAFFKEVLAELQRWVFRVLDPSCCKTPPVMV